MNDATNIALLRSQLYALLAHGFAEPPRTLADWHADNGYANELAATVAKLPGGEALAGALRALNRAHAGVTTEEDFERLRGDYAELFSNLRFQRFPPYETEYTGGANDFLKNQDLADLMGFYRAFGLDLRGGEELRERPDHIAVELEFLHFLCWLEARAGEEGNEEHVDVCLDAEQKFLRDHLGRWAEPFALGLEKVSPEGFFPALATLLRTVVKQEATTLGVTLDPVKVPCPSGRQEPEPLTCGGEAQCPLVQITRGEFG